MKGVFCYVLLTFIVVCALVNGEGDNIQLDERTKRDNEPCGDNLSWALVEGTLTISGTGKMYNFNGTTKGYYKPPWSLRRHLIKTVIIENGVTSIGDYAFSEAIALTNWTIPDSVKSIGNNAFDRCHSLVNATIPASITSIGNNAFFSCVSLKNLIIPGSVKSVGTSAFYGCPALESVIISDGVESLGSSVFEKCENITSVVIPGSVSSIGDSAFSNCNKLNNLVISEGVTSIGNYAFFCSQVSELIIPGTVKSIGDYAFSSCTSLSNLVISDGVETIGDYAFASCEKIENITLPGSLKTIGNNAFSGRVSFKHVFYQGSDPLPSGAFGSGMVPTVCVSPDYNESTFCGGNVTSNDPLCVEFQKMFNRCYEGAYRGGKLVQVRRRNAVVLDDRSNGCVGYNCDNETGKITYHLCNSTYEDIHVCVNDSCQILTPENETNYRVEISITGLNLADTDMLDVISDIIKASGVDEDMIMVSMIIDEEGRIDGVTIYTRDKDTTEKIEQAALVCLDESSSN